MIICRMCARALGVTGTATPYLGVFECSSCPSAGQNDAFVVDDLTPEQKAKVEASHENFSDRLLSKVSELFRREEKPS